MSLILMGSLIGISTSAWAKGEENVVMAEDIVKGAEDFLLERLGGGGEALEIDVQYRGENLVLPEGKLKLDYQMRARNRQTGRFPLTLLVKVDDRLHKRLQLNANVLMNQTVLRMARPINRGERIKAEDIEVDTITSDRPHRKALTQLKDAVGMEATRNLNTGSILTVRAVKPAALVDKNDRVVIIAEKGLMKITAPGRILEKGFQGSMVAVENLQTKKTVYGKVVDPTTVEVIF